jgi:ATP-binding cassette subfamily B multidrug efflux pump
MGPSSTASTASETLQPATARGDLRMLARLWQYLAAQPGRLVLSLLLYPLNAVCVIAPPYLIKRMFDEAIAQHNAQLLGWLAIPYFLALTLEYITGFFSEYSMSILGQQAMAGLRRDLFARVQRLPMAFYDKNPIGRTLTRLTTDVEALAEVFSTGAVAIVSDVLTVVGVVSMMLLLNVRLTLFSFLVVPPLVAVAAVFQRFARRAFRDIRKHIARINAFLAEHLAGMSVVQIFNQQRRTAAEFQDLNDAYRRANRQAIFFDAALFSVVEAIGTCAVAALLWYGAADTGQGSLQAGVLVAFMQYIRRFFIPIRDLSTKYTVLQSGFAAAERVFSLHDESLFSPMESGQRLPRLQKGLQLVDVYFSYRPVRSDAECILRGVSLQVQRGEKVALVGATGSGKTTILKLLNRFYDVHRGAVQVDGVDVRALHLLDLRRLFAVVQQDVYLFSGTLLQNIAFSERISPDAARGALDAVEATEFMRRLPAGYDTQVFEQGINFSAGERQLLSLARALALDPQVLVLDEATSNIDSNTEARIQSALNVVLKDRTAVVVAHRLSTIEKMDRIIVLDQGQVIEQGSHSKLMQAGGAYSRLVEMQFKADPAA